MKMRADNTTFRLAALAAAVAAAFSSNVMAEETDEMTRLIKPESSASLGIGSVDKGNARFGMYRGLQDSGVYGLADIDLVQRDDATGTWFKLRGRNLGLDTRELGLVYGPQADWKLTLEYREIPRFSQYTINTGLQGIGSDNLNVQSAGPRDKVLETKREKLALGFQKSIGDNLSARFRFTNEEKDGTRLFARGTSATVGTDPNRWFNFLAEPIDSTITQWEAMLAYADPRFQLQGGYYGSHYSNHNTSLNITGGGAGLNGAGVGALSPIALAPSNEAHQFFVDGGYSFTPTTRASFKVAYTNATQTDTFIGNPAGVLNTPTTGNISGRSNLGGRVETTLAYIGLSSRPMSKLSLLGSLRYEDRDDRTPVVQYISTTPTGNHDGKNETRSFRASQGKFEANYLVANGYRLVAGLDHDVKDRDTSDVRVVSHRDTTEETAWKIELRRAMSETANGSIAYVNSERTGSDFKVNYRLDGNPGRNVIAPIHLADRDREKIRLSADWTPIESLSLQANIEDARDSYSSRSDLGLGVRRGSSMLYALDATYSASEALSFNAWATHAATKSRQATVINAPEAVTLTAEQISTLRLWTAGLINKTDAIGLGTDLKLSEKLELGADFEYSEDRAEYRLREERNATSAASLPDIKYRTATFRIFGRYALRKNAGIRLDVVHDRRVMDDWTWNTWVYNAPTPAGDGTTVGQDRTQTTTFVGLSGYYKWW